MCQVSCRWHARAPVALQSHHRCQIAIPLSPADASPNARAPQSDCLHGTPGMIASPPRRPSRAIPADTNQQGSRSIRPAYESTPEEEREKDSTTFRLGSRRRMWAIILVGIALFVAVALEAIPAVPRLIMISVAA